MTTVHLVGFCNDNQMVQQYFGCITSRAFNSKEMVLILNGQVHEVTVVGDRYDFKDWGGGHGLSIRKESDGSWRVITGLNCRDSGSSGILTNGGPEMEWLYKSFQT